MHKEACMSTKIAVLVGGYNEEVRAEVFFKSVSMFDEIICSDKTSTDGTAEIAKKYGAKIIKVPHYSTEDENAAYSMYVQERIVKNMEAEWYLNLTYADVVHPRLYERLKATVESLNLDDNINVIDIPWVEWLFGYQDPQLPYCHYSRQVLRKKELLMEELGGVHQELTANKHNIFHMPEDRVVAVHHLTYYNLRYSFIEQHIRYGVKEMRKYQKVSDVGVLFQEIKAHQSWCSNNMKLGKKRGKDYHPYIMPGRMIFLYRAFIYYINVLLLLLDRFRLNNRIEFLKGMVDGLPERGEYNRIGIIRLICKFLFFPFKLLWNLIYGLLLELLSLLVSIIIFLPLLVIMIWDRNRKIPVEQFYSELKQNILDDKLKL